MFLTLALSREYTMSSESFHRNQTSDEASLPSGKAVVIQARPSVSSRASAAAS
jgi:hypothetical protein